MADKRKTPPRVRLYKQPSVKELEQRYGRKFTDEDLKRREKIDALGLKVLELEPGRELTEEEVTAHLTCGFNSVIASVVADAFAGDASALERLLQLHQLIYPQRYELSAAISRAMAVRQLIADLSRVVTPIKGENFLADKSFVKLTDDAAWHRDRYYRLAKQQLQQRVTGKPMTLQSLAINIYIRKANKEGFDSIEQRSIERDLRAARDYDEEQKRLGREPDGNILLTSGEALPFYHFADSWKQRKKYKKQDKSKNS